MIPAALPRRAENHRRPRKSPSLRLMLIERKRVMDPIENLRIGNKPPKSDSLTFTPLVGTLDALVGRSERTTFAEASSTALKSRPRSNPGAMVRISPTHEIRPLELCSHFVVMTVTCLDDSRWRVVLRHRGRQRRQGLLAERGDSPICLLRKWMQVQDREASKWMFGHWRSYADALSVRDRWAAYFKGRRYVYANRPPHSRLLFLPDQNGQRLVLWVQAPEIEKAVRVSERVHPSGFFDRDFRKTRYKTFRQK